MAIAKGEERDYGYNYLGTMDNEKGHVIGPALSKAKILPESYDPKLFEQRYAEIKGFQEMTPTTVGDVIKEMVKKGELKQENRGFGGFIKGLGPKMFGKKS